MAVSALVAALASVIIFAIPPQYRSEATILWQPPEIDGDFVREGRSTPVERAEALKQTMLSRENVVRVADKFQLFPDSRATMSSTSLVKLMRKRVTFEPKPLANVQVTDERSRAVIYTLGFDYENPDVANKVANELLTLFLETSQDKQVSQARENVRFLEDEANRISTQLGQVDSDLGKFNFENQDSLPERGIFLESALERTENSRKEVQRDINKLTEDLRLVDIEIQLNDPNNPGGLAGGSPLQLELQKLKAELVTLKATRSPTHPDVIALQNQIKGIEAQIDQQLAELEESAEKQNKKSDEKKRTRQIEIATQRKASISRMVDVAKQQQDEIDKRIISLEEMLKRVPDVQSKQSELVRRKAGLQKNLEDITSKLNEAQLRLQLVLKQQSERWDVIEQPVAAQEPIWPKVPRLLAMGLGLAGVSGAGVVGVLEFLNRSIRSSTDVLRAVNRHPMVVIPYIMTKEENRRRLRKIMMVLVGLILAFLLALLLVHTQFMALDELYYKLLNRAGV
jgi:polysaccharide biosynthesis transport protein